MTGSNPSIAITSLAERQQIMGLNTSTIIRLDNSTIKRIQTKVTLTQRGSRETRNQRLSGKHWSIIPYDFRLYKVKIYLLTSCNTEERIAQNIYMYW